MTYRRTLRRAVGCTGIGLHTGKPVQLRLEPAPPESGICFYRSDVAVEIPARLEYLARLDHATTLSRDGVSIGTVEHLLSALNGLGVDDVRVGVNGPEVPILDGSAAPFVILIHEAGLRPQPATRRYIKVREPVEVVRGSKRIRVSPSEHLQVSYEIGFDHPLLRRQAISLRLSPSTFVERIAPARTFGFLREVEMLRQNGLALGGSLENAVVIGESGVLNKLRFPDEFVRHKVLDALGDLALLGHPIVGHIEACKAGHALHTALARELVSRPEAWSLVTRPQLPAFDMPAGAGPELAPEPHLARAEPARASGGGGRSTPRRSRAARSSPGTGRDRRFRREPVARRDRGHPGSGARPAGACCPRVAPTRSPVSTTVQPQLVEICTISRAASPMLTRRNSLLTVRCGRTSPKSKLSGSTARGGAAAAGAANSAARAPAAHALKTRPRPPGSSRRIPSADACRRRAARSRR